MLNLLAGRDVGAAPQAAPSAVEESVQVLPPSCEASSFPLIAFVDALRVELASTPLRCCTVEDGDGSSGASVTVSLEIVPCAADADRVRILVRRLDASQGREREISLADVAKEAHPRALALAVAELVRWMEPVQRDETPRPQPAPTDAPPAPITTSAPAVPPALAFTVRLEGEGRGMPMLDTMLWGGRLRLVARRRVLHADLDVGVDAARAQSPLGDVLIRSATVGIGFGPTLETHATTIDLGPRAELGWGWVRGRTTVPHVHARAASDPIFTLALRASLEAPADWRARPAVAVEGGGVVSSLTGAVDGEPTAGIAGYYVLGAVGVAVSP